jgi:hypothetical protein
VITPRPGRAAALAAWAALREWRVTTAVEAASPLAVTRPDAPRYGAETRT